MTVIDRQELLNRYYGEEKALLARVIDLVEKVLKTHQPQVTDFHDPYHTGLVFSVLTNIPDMAVVANGGYAEAERTRTVIYPDYMNSEQVDAELGFLEVKGRFKITPATHRDYLGSLMALGLKREKLGDIIVMDDGAYLIVDNGVTQYIMSNLTRIGKVRVEVRKIGQQDLQLPEPNIKPINTTVPSMRLDAVAAAGYGTSRSKIVREIKAQKININWCSCSDPAAVIKEGDMLSMRGRGRVKVAVVKGNTKKGRVALELHKYI